MNDLTNVNLKWGKNWDMNPKLYSQLCRFTYLIYVGRSTAESTNDLRYHLFLQNFTFYQAGGLRNCLTNSAALPYPQSCRRLIENYVLHAMWMSGLPTPDAVLKLTPHKCRKECTMSSCQCMTYKLKCTAACTLRNCRNTISEV